MTPMVHKTSHLGELVVAAFDEAAQYSTDPREVSRLATAAVMHMVRRGRMPSHAPWLEPSPPGK